MKRMNNQTIKRVLFACALLIGVLFLPVQIHAKDTQEESYVSDEILITYKDSVSDSTIEKIAERKDGEVTETAELLDDKVMAVVEVSKDQSVEEAVDEYESSSKILSAQPNYIYKTVDPIETKSAKTYPNDSYRGDQWYLQEIEAFNAWYLLQNAGISNSPVKVAVIDTGVDTSHTDLTGQLNVPASKTITSQSTTASLSGDGNGHGTNVNGIIGAKANNSKGISGVSTGASNQVSQLINLDIFPGSAKETKASYVLGALNYVNSYNLNHPESKISIINMSLGSYASDPALQSTCQELKNKGVTIICAAGNESTSKICYPAGYPSTISVASTGASEQKSTFSNYGSTIDLSAPGENLLSTYPNTLTPIGYPPYAWMSGTSQASPVVAGVAAMIKYIYPGATPDQIQQILQSTARDIYTSGKDTYSGYGIVNAKTAVIKALQSAGKTPAYMAKNIQSCTVSAISNQVCSGASLKPAIVVKDGSKTLVNGKDYRVSYYNNVKPGTAMVCVIGIDDYQGMIQKSFTIRMKSMGSIKTKASGAGKVKISWGKIPGASGYRIYQSIKKNGTYSRIKTVTSGNTTSYTKGGLAGGQEYYYKVRAYAGNNTYTNYSGVKKGYTGKKYSLTGTVKKKVKIKTTTETTGKTVKTISKKKQVKVIRFAVANNGQLWCRITYKKSGKSYTGYLKASQLRYKGSGTIYKSGSIRKKASDKAKKTVKAGKGKTITITGVKLGKGSKLWYQVKYKKGSKTYKGYMSQTYLK